MHFIAEIITAGHFLILITAQNLQPKENLSLTTCGRKKINVLEFISQF